MLDRQTQLTSKESRSLISTKSNSNHRTHHGSPDSRILLNIPFETLTGITSYLSPPSLLSLAAVHSRLDEHVKNDNTWRRAFLCQFLGIGPETEIRDNVKSLLLRRSETTWKNELIVRYRLIRRWERSRNSTTVHIPVHSEISDMHLMRNHSLLTSSIQYGIVSRSLPLHAKILPGYLDTSGTRFGLGLGNPNAEFSPNVTACALASEGDTARILWGFRHGEVAVLTAPRAIEAARRPLTNLVRSNIGEVHEGAVLDITWDDAGELATSAGADGRVKIWDTKTMQCLWTSETKTRLHVSDACVKVGLSVSQGFIVVVTRSGEIFLWMGFNLQHPGDFSPSLITEIRVACPVMTTVGEGNKNEAHDVISLHVDPYSLVPTILVAYQDDAYFYRLSINANDVQIRTFGDESFGPISAIAPFFAAESSFVITGDHLGCVSVYDWNSVPHIPGSPVQCSNKFEAHKDGASVSALAWNGVTLITGSARGTTHVWDALTFEHLKSFASPVPRTRGREGRERAPVRRILISPEKEVVLISVGDTVLAWKAGPVSSRQSTGGVRGRHGGNTPGKRKKDGHGIAKYIQQNELNQAISESKSILEQESKYTRQITGRQQAQQKKLESMGLNEAEAIQYVLMLSRDEAMQSVGVEEGIFEGDFDDIPDTLGPVAGSSNTRVSMPESVTSTRPTFTHSNISVYPTGRPIHRITPKPIQGIPTPVHAARFSPEASSLSPPSDVPSSDEAHFPPISTSVSPTPSSIISTAGSSQLYTEARQVQAPSSCSVSASPQSVRSTSAWSTPLSRPIVNASSPARSYSQGNSDPKGAEIIDDELRFALELSLAEARSRGENV